MLGQLLVGTRVGGNNGVIGERHGVVEDLNDLRDGDACCRILIQEAIDDGAKVRRHVDV